nr:hypothetical protein [Tanacetum cinerariifolium]
MVNVLIQQDLSSISLMTSSIIDLTSRPESPKVSKAISEVATDAVDWDMQAPLRNRFRDLPEADMKEILHQRMWETESYKSHEDHMQLFKALEKLMNRDHSEELAQDLAEARKKKKKSRESPKTPPGSPPHPPPPLPAGPSGATRASGSSQVPPPPPLSTNQDSHSKGSAAPSSSKTVASAEYQAWTRTDIRLRPSISLTPADLEINKDMDWWKPFEEERPATPEPAWSIRSSDVPVPTNNWASALASNYSPPPEDSLLVFHPDVIHLQYQMEECHKLLTDSVDDPILRHNVNKPLPLGGPPGQVTIQSDFFFNKDLEYLRYDSKGSRHTLSISKMKAAYYPDAGLEQMVPDQFGLKRSANTILLQCMVSLTGGSKDNDSTLIDTHLKVIAEQSGHICGSSMLYESKSFPCMGHLNHLPPKDKKILTTAVNQWTRHLVIRQRVEDFQLGIESYQTQLNLTKPQWDATGFEYKHDYTVIDSPRAVMFRGKYWVQMMMRFTEIHKFSNSTLQQIDEALDYRVKEFRINKMNPGLNTRFWTRKDVDQSKAFMFAIQKRLKTRRIFRNQKSFVGRRIREGDYRLLKLSFNSLVHSFRALSALRRSGLRTASTAAKPCQGDSSEFYLITGRIPTVAAAGQRDVNSQPHAHTLKSVSMTQWQMKDLQHSFRDSDVCCYVQEKCGYGFLMSQPHKMAMLHSKDSQEMYRG